MIRYCFLIGLVLYASSVFAEEIGSADLNGDGTVNTLDFGIFVKQFGLSQGEDGFVEDLRVSDVMPVLNGLKNRLDEINYLHLHRVVMGSAPATFVGGEIGGPYLDLEVHKSDLKRFLHRDSKLSENGHDNYAYFVNRISIPSVGDLAVVSHFGTHIPYPVGGPRPDTLSFKLLVDANSLDSSGKRRFEEILIDHSSGNSDREFLYVHFIAIHR